MTAIGGSIETVSLGGREFPSTSEAEVQRKLGGMENDVDSNGNGSARIIQTRNAWSLSGVIVENDDNRGDQEYIQDLMDSKDFFDVDITYCSGAVYQVRGQIVGENAASSKSATMALNLKGPQRLTKQ